MSVPLFYIVRSGSIQILKESADNAELARREPGALLGVVKGARV